LTAGILLEWNDSRALSYGMSSPEIDLKTRKKSAEEQKR